MTYRSWPVETHRRHSAVEDYQKLRRERLEQWIDRDAKRIKLLIKANDPRLERIQDRYIRFVQEYYALGGIPKNLHPY